jgi:hypothetical protein
MAKFASNDVMDAALAVIATANRLVVLAGQPSDYAGADAGRLAEAPLGPSDFLIGDGAAGARRLTIAPRAGLAALASGMADHVALLDAIGQRLVYVTTCPTQSLAVGTPVQVDGWHVEIGRPV